MLKKNKSKSLFLNLIIIVLTLFLILHYSFVALYAGPLNPISTSMKGITDKYIGRIFQQNWHLFAPEPVTENIDLYFRVKYKDTAQNIVESNWYSLTGYMIAENDKTLFSPYNRIVRIGSGMVHQLNIGGKDDLTYLILQNKEKDKKLSSKVKKALSEESLQYENTIYRLASSFAKKQFPNQLINEVQFMTSVTDAIPFSKRNDTVFQPKKEQVIYDWREIDADVVSLP